MDHTRPLFKFVFIFSIQFIVNKIVYDWIRSGDLYVLEVTAQPTASQPLPKTVTLSFAIFLKKSPPWGVTIAQWIRLHLPFCRPGLSPKHTIHAFIIYSICAICICRVKRKKINKRGLVWPILNKKNHHILFVTDNFFLI